MKRFYAFIMGWLHRLTWPISGLYFHNSRRVRVLVQFKDEILLQKTSFGTQNWSLPGGGIKRNETAVAAAVRETHEETGLILTEAMLVCIGEKRVVARGRWPAINMIFFSVSLPTRQAPVIHHPVETLDVNWFKRSAIPQKHSKTVDTAFKLHSKKQI